MSEVLKDILGAIGTLSTVNELLSGSVAGASQVLVGQPLDTIKTRAQIAPPGMFKGPMDILAQTVRREGFFALYKGMASPLVGIAVSPYPELTLRQTALAGSMAGAVNSLLASPVELFKVRMQGQYGGLQDKRLSKVATDLYRKFGFRNGIMRGFWVTVAREIPAYAGFYTGFEFAKRQFRRTYGDALPTWALLASGSTGGICYWLACYPLDVAKSRVQLAEKPPIRGIRYIAAELKSIVREQGMAGLYRGLSPCLIRSIPAAGVTFFAFERTREYLLQKTGV